MKEFIFPNEDSLIASCIHSAQEKIYLLAKSAIYVFFMCNLDSEPLCALRRVVEEYRTNRELETFEDEDIFLVQPDHKQAARKSDLLSRSPADDLRRSCEQSGCEVRFSVGENSGEVQAKNGKAFIPTQASGSVDASAVHNGNVVRQV